MKEHNHQQSMRRALCTKLMWCVVMLSSVQLCHQWYLYLDDCQVNVVINYLSI